MRRVFNINAGWKFIKADIAPDKAESAEGLSVDVPYTWNGKDGQDGGGDYYRGRCLFVKRFTSPEFGADERVYLEF